MRGNHLRAEPDEPLPLLSLLDNVGLLCKSARRKRLPSHLWHLHCPAVAAAAVAAAAVVAIAAVAAVTAVATMC